MIGSFADEDTENLFHNLRGHRSWQSFERVARRKLLMLDVADRLADLKNPPGSKLEELRKERRGQYAIRINDRYRLCFTWRDARAYDVETTDYHDD